MKKTLLYVGLILFAGMLAGALVCGLVWMQTLYELSMSLYHLRGCFLAGDGGSNFIWHEFAQVLSSHL